ncbi:MAG TPA: DEAD/DEAH box helicase [Burkholderiales bacterium]|nr:DEAD/DEAH box helicase [Burkholderiales bacterium]
MQTFESLGLIAELLRAVSEEGYREPTPIQSKAIPPILQRRDMMGCAQTGTGKTAGFTLPLLQLLAPQANTSLSPARHPIRVLVLTPTRELAAQVEESVRVYGKYLSLRSAVVFGGMDIGPQIKQLHAGVEILVATPGRLLDHLHQKTVNLSRVEFLVLDEADRMLDMGFIPDIKRILAVLPARRQNLLFSATFPEEVRRLSKELLHAPVTVDVAPRNAPAELVTHQVHLVPEPRKRALLVHLIRSRDMRQVLVFVRMKRDANRLARQLQHDGIVAKEIHSDRTQAERMQALDEFKQGKVPVLVATDIAARGLDIEQLPFVINYELPHTPEDYVHRIGRTGRAGLPGEAIALVGPEEIRFLEDIERLLKRKLPRASTPDIKDDSRPAHRVREPRHERSPARHASRPPTSSAPRPAPGGFDYNKPYEPAAPTERPPGGEPPQPPRRGPARPMAALLGGGPAKREPQK